MIQNNAVHDYFLNGLKKDKLIKRLVTFQWNEMQVQYVSVPNVVIIARKVNVFVFALVKHT